MRKIIGFEIERAFKSREMLYSLLIGFSIVIAHFCWFTVPSYIENVSGTYKELSQQPMALYSHWIGGEYITVLSILFYWMLPILAVLPFGMSFYWDRKNGYIKNIVTRIEKKKYLLSKFIAVFLSAGTALVLPLLLNFMLTAGWLPALQPECSTGDYPIFANSMWSELFYTKPLLYVILFLVIDFILAGSLAIIALAAVYWLDNVFVVLLSPFLVYWIADTTIITYFGEILIQYNPRFLAMPSQPIVLEEKSVIIVVAILLIIPFSIYYRKGKKEDIL